jgi:hypothetical protein
VEPRSGCPINTAVEILGDRWSLIVLRDVIFGDRRYFRALLTGSIEGIASNILADRLVRLQVVLCRCQRPFKTRSSADRPAGPQFGLPPGRPRFPFWPISIKNRLFIAASPRARRTVASSAWV